MTVPFPLFKIAACLPLPLFRLEACLPLPLFRLGSCLPLPKSAPFSLFKARSMSANMNVYHPELHYCDILMKLVLQLDVFIQCDIKAKIHSKIRIFSHTSSLNVIKLGYNSKTAIRLVYCMAISLWLRWYWVIFPLHTANHHIANLLG